MTEKIGWDEPTEQPTGGGESYVYGRPGALPERFQVSARGTNPLQAPWNLLIAGALYLIAVLYLAYLIIVDINSTTELTRHDFFWEMVVLKVVALAGILVLVGAMLLAQPWGRYGLTVVSVIGILVVIMPGMWPATLLGLGAVIALWLPRGHAWFGF
ncbi:MAG: hypothetical protein Q4G50_02025 [Corynebacterium sp.]|uniref:hypothetical protein n=1 Tax=Corynebacterium sp. TaxID=1720 RepID=UPI0026DFCA05|nr:hypothetical protein [Corynebacterium sp.]MDO5668760.1 hypothetical protein [Corynebacterium sp.]